MQLVKLGSSDLMVTECCLGTMTWGVKNTEQEGHEQIDFALSKGVNFIDTAEMYAVPPNASTYGSTEKIIGTWIAKNPHKRKDIILMSKIAGKGMNYIRNGESILAEHIQKSIDDSLERLQTDYMDVYQLHWPNRPYPYFGKHWPGRADFGQTDKEQEEDEIHGVLSELEKAIKSGKIRHFGLSNETAWGVATYCRLAKEHDLPKPVSLQNEFSLVHSLDYPFVIEASTIEDVAYIPWSALGGGVLSGKYMGGKRPAGSRWEHQHPRHGNFRDTENVAKATEKYVAIAKKYDITPSQLAYAWCQQFPWITSTIIGATSMAQLKENMKAFDIKLSEDCLKDIHAVLQDFPIPF
jgi:aryl-alcohol dehydrogenase-like predicted oxidoreductase